jgi:hypothetical protein
MKPDVLHAIGGVGSEGFRFASLGRGSQPQIRIMGPFLGRRTRSTKLAKRSLVENLAIIEWLFQHYAISINYLL